MNLAMFYKNIASLSAETGSAAQLSSAEHQAATADAAIMHMCGTLQGLDEYSRHAEATAERTSCA